MLKYLIGCDPELFLVDEKGSGKSAHNVIPGDKSNPFPVLNGAVQVDGVAAEFNIFPAATADQFVGNIRDVLQELSERIEEKNPGLQLIVQPTMTFDKTYFKKLPKKTKLLGCEPDFNVYTGSANPPPASNAPFRTGGGHIHIGWTEGANVNDGAHQFDCIEATKQLDSVLYICSLLWDSDKERRTLYGKVGTYRPKHYGVEYRPLSNAWVADPDLQKWVFNASTTCMEAIEDDVKFYHDYFQQDLIKDIKEDKDPPRLTLLEYHDYIQEEFQIPPLPEAYTRVHH